MPATRGRLTSRSLMLAVVAFAFSLKLGLAYSRSPAYWREARFQGQMANSFRFYATRFEDGSATTAVRNPEERQLAATRARAFAANLDRQRSRYLRAAFLPWLPSSPELPTD